MKNMIMGVVCLIIAAALIVNSIFSLHSYLIGIYTRVDVNVAEIRHMRNMWQLYGDWLDVQHQEGAIDFNQWLEWEKEKTKNELKVLNAIEPFVEKLDRTNQLKG